MLRYIKSRKNVFTDDTIDTALQKIYNDKLTFREREFVRRYLMSFSDIEYYRQKNDYDSFSKTIKKRIWDVVCYRGTLLAPEPITKLNRVFDFKTPSSFVEFIDSCKENGYRRTCESLLLAKKHRELKKYRDYLLYRYKSIKNFKETLKKGGVEI